MITGQDIEGYLIKMGVSYDVLGKDVWMIRDEDVQLDNLVVTLNDPVVVFHVTLANIPEQCDRLPLYEELLRLNATEMLHGAYGLERNAEGDIVVATDTLQADDMDFNEFQSSVDALHLSIRAHYRRLSPYLEKKTSTKVNGARA